MSQSRGGQKASPGDRFGSFSPLCPTPYLGHQCLPGTTVRQKSMGEPWITTAVEVKNKQREV